MQRYSKPNIDIPADPDTFVLTERRNYVRFASYESYVKTRLPLPRKPNQNRKKEKYNGRL
jgi:hypothetical protein